MTIFSVTHAVIRVNILRLLGGYSLIKANDARDLAAGGGGEL
jgi:hypothetical protein